MYHREILLRLLSLKQLQKGLAMTEGERALLVVQVITTFIIALTQIVYFFQLITMRRGSQAQNILALVSFLQEESIRSARRTVRATLRERKWPKWKNQDELRRDVDKVCSSYDVVAIIVRKGLVPKDIIIDNWGPSVIDCYETVEPYIQEMRRPENSGPRYWDDFTWLYEESKGAFDPLWQPSSNNSHMLGS
jgi:hypothetical protein